MHRGSALALSALLEVAALVPPARSQNIGAVGSEFQVNQFTPGNQFGYSLSFADDKSFVLVWTSESQGGEAAEVWGRRFNSNGSPAAGEFHVNTTTVRDQKGASVASDKNGNFVVVWHSDHLVQFIPDIYMRRYSSNGSELGTEQLVNAYTTGIQGGPTVAVAPDGSFVVVWGGQGQNANDDFNRFFGRRFDSSGTAIGNDFVASAYTSARVYNHSVGIADDGQFVVVWMKSDGSGRGIFGQRMSSSGNLVGSEFQVNSSSAGNQDLRYGKSVGVDADGDFVVCWDGPDANNGFVYAFARRFSSAGTVLGTEVEVGSGNQPGVGSASDGSFVVVWAGALGYLSGQVFGQHYSSTGEPLGARFRVNDDTDGGHYFARIGKVVNGYSAVVWSGPPPGTKTASPEIVARRLGILPTSTPSPTATPSPTTPTFTPTPSPSSSPTVTQTPPPTSTPKITSTIPSPTPSTTPTETPVPLVVHAPRGAAQDAALGAMVLALALIVFRRFPRPRSSRE